MGTNFYGWWGEEQRHIGKRSAAGMYCWDCDETLCTGGKEAVHMGTHRFAGACLKCGAVALHEGLQGSAAGRELGFNQSPPAAKTGVASCSSFAWAVEPAALEGVGKIEDEYGSAYTRPEFQAVLSECPIQDFEYIGREFS